MDSLTSASPVAVPPAIPDQPPRIWKFWGTSLWGLFIFAMLFVGQLAVVAWFVFRGEGPFDLAGAIRVVSGGLTISLSVIMGLPAAVRRASMARHAAVAHAVCGIPRAALALVAASS